MNCTDDEFHEWLEDFDYDSLETTYGIHDFAGGDTDDEHQVGFMSYEISRENFPIVMEIWRKGLFDAGFISDDIKVEASDGDLNAVIVISNPDQNYTEKYEVDILRDVFQEDYEEDYMEFVEDKFEDCEYLDDDFQYIIEYNDLNKNWKLYFDKIVIKVTKYFKKLGFELKKLD